MTIQNSMNEIADVIKSTDDFCIITHISPDGDAVGSSCALFGLLKKLGKQAVITCADKIPKLFYFLPYYSEIQRIENLKDKNYKVAIAVDCADKARMGASAAIFDKAEKTICIDHHTSNTGFAEFNVIDADAAATGEMIFKLIDQFNDRTFIDKAIASCIYTALVTDTGNFTYSNTNTSAFGIMIKLMEAGVDLSYISVQLYQMIPFEKTALIARAINNTKMLLNGTLGISCLARRDFTETGALDEHIEGVIENIRSIDTVKVAVLMKETNSGRYKVSLRSKNGIDVSAIAGKFGGGGHKSAAGCVLNGPFEHAFSTIAAAAEAAMNV